MIINHSLCSHCFSVWCDRDTTLLGTDAQGLQHSLVQVRDSQLLPEWDVDAPQLAYSVLIQIVGDRASTPEMRDASHTFEMRDLLPTIPCCMLTSFLSRYAISALRVATEAASRRRSSR